jgi:hypothetical protein
MRASATDQFYGMRHSDKSFNDSGLGGNTMSFAKEGGDDEDSQWNKIEDNIGQDVDMFVIDMSNAINQIDPGEANRNAKEKMEDAMIQAKS